MSTGVAKETASHVEMAPGKDVDVAAAVEGEMATEIRKFRLQKFSSSSIALYLFFFIAYCSE
jgi:hypothetical protein